MKITEQETTINVFLDLANMLPDLGEVADVASVINYINGGEPLFAAFSMVSMVPEIGNLIGKGGKIDAWLSKVFPTGASIISKDDPSAISGIKKLQNLVIKHRDLINRLFLTLEQNEKFVELVPLTLQTKGALTAFINTNYEEPPPPVAERLTKFKRSNKMKITEARLKELITEEVELYLLKEEIAYLDEGIMKYLDKLFGRREAWEDLVDDVDDDGKVEKELFLSMPSKKKIATLGLLAFLGASGTEVFGPGGVYQQSSAAHQEMAQQVRDSSVSYTHLTLPTKRIV